MLITSRILLLTFISTASVYSANIYATPAKSEYYISGVKYPNSVLEGDSPIKTEVKTMRESDLQGFNDLVPYILPSPDQEDAGSCLYMSLTGIAEWWLAKLNTSISRQPEGPIDLSERYMMNIAGIDEDSSPALNWKTDSILLFNKDNKSVLNTGYRFTKGWFKENEKGDLIRAEPKSEGADYTTQYNWIDERNLISGSYVSLPTFKRDIIFADPASDQWNVGVAPADIVTRVKTALKTKMAPVNVIYNHFGYWHSIYIVGYDDDLSTDECKFVNKFRKFIKDDADSWQKKAEAETDPVKKEKLLKRYQKSFTTSKKIEKAYTDGGGCSPKGMFYVRDSIYSAPTEPLYDYDLNNTGDEGNYSKKIVLHEYEWLKYLSNHVTQIYVE